MNFPMFATFATKSNREERFEKAVKLLEDGIANKNIWNVDYVAAKDTLSRIWDRASDEVYKPLVEFYYRGDPRRADDWADNDPRRNLGLCQFMNTPGYLKKLLTVRNAPELGPYIALLGEAAKFATDFKQVKPYIVKGRKPSENPKEVDYTNTGICSVCSSRQKLTFDGRLVAHGYTLERNWGGRSGICSGTKHLAWEISPEGAIAYRDGMVKFLATTEELLKNLEADKFESNSEMVRVRKAFGRFDDELRTYNKATDPENFYRVHQKDIAKAKQTIHYLKGDIAMFNDRIAKWQEQPLKYGGAETQERWKAKFLASSRNK